MITGLVIALVRIFAACMIVIVWACALYNGGRGNP
jgi:hypothetical protein